MLSHLHLHLEPEERKRRFLGLPAAAYTSREEFFRSHDLGRNDRLHVTEEDLVTFLREVHKEQAGQGVEYVELRFSPRRFLAQGADWSGLLASVHSALRTLSKPSMRAILLVNRDSPEGFVAQCRDQIDAGLPWTFVGLDVAGDETRYPETPMLPELFTAARKAGLGVTVHAGEFGAIAEVWRAVDELGATRLGHAVAAATSSTLLARLARDRILVEVSVTSNLALGAVTGGAPHPVRRFVDARVPVCFNTDVPLHTGRTMADEYRHVERELRVDRESVLRLQRQAYNHAFR